VCCDSGLSAVGALSLVAALLTAAAAAVWRCGVAAGLLSVDIQCCCCALLELLRANAPAGKNFQSCMIAQNTTG
jgi:hypothetical protein